MMAALLLLGCLPGAAARRDGSSMPGAVARRDGSSMPGAAALYERKVYSIDRSWRFSLCEDDACAQGSPASCPGGLPFEVTVTVAEAATGRVVGSASAKGAATPPVGAGANFTTLDLPPSPSRARRSGARVAVSLRGHRRSRGGVARRHDALHRRREVAWKADSGLWLNGAPYKIRGAANHQDFAGVGVAVPDALQAFACASSSPWARAAWRTAHNAPTPALLDACDAEGMLVWDETHRNGNPGEQTRLVLRDRNHPPWSSGASATKLCETNDTLGDGKAAAALYRELDPSSGRAVSANYNPWRPPDYPGDVVGIDYATDTYDAEHAKNASMPFISSETSSAVSDRGEYASDAVAAHVSGYDTTAPSWGEVAEDAWGGVGEADAQGILTRPFISGGFTWTGFDYKGEPTPYSWPNINSHFGILDIAGFEKDRFYYYQSIFKPEPVAHLFPHWNWAVEVVDAEGRVVPTADANVTLASSAALRFIGGGNGDPSEHTADKSASRPAFHGLLLGVFEATGGAAAATVTATAAASTPRSSTSRSSPAAPRPTVPALPGALS
ncbi:arogenate dehydratase [Aureococcus anophagefferens]|nr:arogenate dehydratase [Aureococcus anophagefferens]